MLLYEFVVLENADARVKYIVDNMGKKLSDAAAKDSSSRADNPTEIVQTLLKADPTNGQAIMWLTRMYSKGAFKMEDVNRVRNDLTDFFRVRSKLANKDLNSYKDLNQLYDAIESVQGEPTTSKRQQKQAIKHEGAQYVINTPEFKVLEIKNHDAACFYGSNTKWCTASKDDPSMFNTYTEQGPLFVVITNRDGKQRKFQLHYESDQFMDERDNPVPEKDIQYLSSFPEYADFLNMLIDKHYSKYVS